MEKEFVPYELAVRLKELGFDESCFSYYEPNGNLKYVENHIVKDFPFLAKNSEWQDLVAALLYQQAFRWFREKHGLRIRNYGSINYSNELSEYFEVFKYGYGTSDKSLSILVGALTYEKAELACLTKLIEIVEQIKN